MIEKSYTLYNKNIYNFKKLFTNKKLSAKILCIIIFYRLRGVNGLTPMKI